MKKSSPLFIKAILLVKIDWHSNANITLSMHSLIMVVLIGKTSIAVKQNFSSSGLSDLPCLLEDTLENVLKNPPTCLLTAVQQAVRTVSALSIWILKSPSANSPN